MILKTLSFMVQVFRGTHKRYKTTPETIKKYLFIDDNSKLWDTRIEGIKVHGPHELKRLYQKHNIDTVIIAIQNPKAERKRHFLHVLNPNQGSKSS